MTVQVSRFLNGVRLLSLLVLAPLVSAQQFEVCSDRDQHPVLVPSLCTYYTVPARHQAAERLQLSGDPLKKEQADYWFTSPLPGLVLQGNLPVCERDAYYGELPKVLPRTFVLAGTLDPKTRIAAAHTHVAALKAAGPVQLVELDGSPHFVLAFASECFVRTVQSFVLGIWQQAQAVNSAQSEGCRRSGRPGRA
ncbi:MAG: hypothetical protein JNN30_04060 [Rhodanobacteraceae bacterium]|nr:hypothetical protein [Rhodanobacteraceae bacterium]